MVFQIWRDYSHRKPKGSTTKDELVEMLKTKRLVFLVVPYLIGLVWHSFHPFGSVLTGGFNRPRRCYIDENSIEPSFFRTLEKYELIHAERKRPIIASLCSSLDSDVGIEGVSCFRSEGRFEVARIIPEKSAALPTSEAIVVVVPASDNWLASQYHVSLLQMIRRLTVAPWLSKSILVVTPVSTHSTTGRNDASNTNSLLSETVLNFLEDYLGSATKPHAPWTGLPDSFKGAMLRQMIVMDIEYGERDDEQQPLLEARILPQGRRGVLPNMDLTYLVSLVYSRFTTVPLRNQDAAVIVAHPYLEKANQLFKAIVEANFSKQYHDMGRRLIALLMFEYSLLMGPYPPHASALDRGLDSLTVQIILREGNYSVRNSHTAEFVQKMELVLRSLSNLHERLHHSTSLYLLLSPELFVKHEEYLIPNLLLLIPLVVRALTLVVFDIPVFDWNAAFWATQTLVIAVAFFVTIGFPLMDRSIGSSTMVHNPMLPLYGAFGLGYLYVIIQALWLRRRISSSTAQSIQLIACMLALVTHLPIAFCHVSLAFPSALLWTPFIAMPSFAPKSKGGPTIKWLKVAVWLGITFVSCPATFLVPHIFPSYTVYVKYCYLPLHLAATFLFVLHA